MIQQFILQAYITFFCSLLIASPLVAMVNAPVITIQTYAQPIVAPVTHNSHYHCPPPGWSCIYGASFSTCTDPVAHDARTNRSSHASNTQSQPLPVIYVLPISGKTPAEEQRDQQRVIDAEKKFMAATTHDEKIIAAREWVDAVINKNKTSIQWLCNFCKNNIAPRSIQGMEELNKARQNLSSLESEIRKAQANLYNAQEAKKQDDQKKAAEQAKKIKAEQEAAKKQAQKKAHEEAEAKRKQQEKLNAEKKAREEELAAEKTRTEAEAQAAQEAAAMQEITDAMIDDALQEPPAQQPHESTTKTAHPSPVTYEQTPHCQAPTIAQPFTANEAAKIADIIATGVAEKLVLHGTPPSRAERIKTVFSNRFQNVLEHPIKTAFEVSVATIIPLKVAVAISGAAACYNYQDIYDSAANYYQQAKNDPEEALTQLCEAAVNFLFDSFMIYGAGKAGAIATHGVKSLTTNTVVNTLQEEATEQFVSKINKTLTKIMESTEGKKALAEGEFDAITTQLATAIENETAAFAQAAQPHPTPPTAAQPSVGKNPAAPHPTPPPTVTTATQAAAQGTTQSTVTQGSQLSCVPVTQSAEAAVTSSAKTNLDTLSAEKILHLIEGSTNSAHNWHKIVPDKNWNNIKAVLNEVLTTGQDCIHKGGSCKKKIVNNETVYVSYRIIEGVIKIGSAWVA